MRSISVIVPLYYGGKYIANIIQQIESCKAYLDQEDYIELLFVNDAPNAPISQDWKTEAADITVINTEKNVGIHGARLKGLFQCHGEYILFLDQDDRIKPEYFYSQLNAMGESDAVICKVIEAGEPYYLGDNAFEKMVCKDFIVGKRNPIVSPGQVLIRRNAIPTAWIENVLEYNGADDWFLWLCMIGENCCFVLNPEILYEHIVQESNASANLLEMRQSEQEVIRIILEKNIFTESNLKLLMNGFFEMNMIRMEDFYFTKKVLDIKHRHDLLLDNWLHLRDIHFNISEFFKIHNYNTIAIYGAGRLGLHLFYELRNQDIEIIFAIDANSENIQFPIPLYSPEEQMPLVDAIVITVIDQYKEIAQILRKRVNSIMIPLEEIIQELMSVKFVNK